MFIGLSFIGVLPNYIVDCIHQIRCYFDGDVWLITDDVNSQFIEKIIKYDVKIINYQQVIDNNLIEILNTNKHKFLYLRDMPGRELLFIRSFERFFLLNNLMIKYNLNDCLFVELDNLIYNDPRIWLSQMSKSNLCYMYDNVNHFSSGIMYIKNTQSIKGFLDYLTNFIKNSNEFMSEMRCLSDYFNINRDEVQILPTYWENKEISSISYENYKNYNDTIFDAAAIGIFLLGMDPYHTNGVIKTGLKHNFSAIDYTDQKFEWKKDELGRLKPYIWNGEKWILINNLHVHSKQLMNGLSTPLTGFCI